LSASGGTTDINRIKQSAEFQELVDRLWERWRGKKVTRDVRGRPNRRSFANFLANVILAAYRARVPDPYKDIDWEHVIDPDLSPSENYGLLEQRLGLRFEERPPIPGETDEDVLRSQIESTELQIRELDFMIRHGQDERGNRLTPEQIESLRRQKEDLEKFLEALRRKLEEVEAKKPLPTPERGRGAPRRRARPAEERAPAPAPAPAPQPAPPAEEEEVERARLWELFALALTAAGLDPSQYEDEFESIYNAVRGRPYLEKFRAVMRHASAIIKENRPEVYVPTEAITRQVEEAVRRELESLAERLTPPAPPRPEEYLTAAEAELASVPPEESIQMVPVDAVDLTPEECGGHNYIWAPDANALGLMRGYGVSTWVIRKFFTCPERWWGEANGSTDLEFTVETMREINEVPRFFADWLMELAKAIDDRYEEEGRLRGITRLSEFRKRHRGPITSVGR
jgi:hypothetical protein